MNKKPCLLFVNLRRLHREAYQSILSAHALGFEIILLTNQKIPTIFACMLKHIEFINTYDMEIVTRTVSHLARKYLIVGVPSWTEIDVVTVANIADTLGLPGLPPKQAHLARNKFLMKQALLKVNPNILPKFSRVTHDAELKFSMESIGFPAIIKPLGASGSKGIFKLHHPSDLGTVLYELKKIANPNFDPVFQQYGCQFIVEEYLDGHEFSVEGIIYQNKINIIVITDKWTTDPFHIEYQHILPTRLNASEQTLVHLYTEQILRGLHFDNCAFHLEAKLTSKGFRFIEVAARLGGDYITSHLVPSSLGVNLYQAVIQTAVGHLPDLISQQQCFSGIRFLLANNEGVFNGIDQRHELETHPTLSHFFLEIPVGSEIFMPPRHFGLQRLGACIVTSHTHELCQEQLAMCASLTKTITTPF